MIPRLVGEESVKIQKDLKLLFDPKDMLETGIVYNCEKIGPIQRLKNSKPIANYLINYFFGWK